MKWIKSITREIPFHTIENWQYVYFKGWSKLLGFNFKKIIYYSKKSLIDVYRIKKDQEEFIKKLKNFCLKKPEKVISYYNELEKLDKKILSLKNKKIKTKEELKKYLKEIDSFMEYYATIYLTKTYTNRYAIDDEVIKKQPRLAKIAKKLDIKAIWFDLSNSIVRKTSKILNLPEEIVSYLSLGEIIRFVDTGKVDYKLARKRCNGFAWNLKTNRIYYGKKADKYIKSLRVEETSESRDKIKGSVAFKGKVKGRVVVVLTSHDFKKIRKGDILVTHMTTPWYIPYISKVKAIVTDEGGVGSHAANIAREMKKPCVIGTKIATKALKDGDIVEVDANKGVVRKLK